MPEPLSPNEAEAAGSGDRGAGKDAADFDDMGLEHGGYPANAGWDAEGVGGFSSLDRFASRKVAPSCVRSGAGRSA